MNKGMKKHVCKAAACLVGSTLLMAGGTMTAMAAGSSMVGVETIGTTKAEAAETKKETKKNKKKEAKAEEVKTEEVKTEETAEAEETQAAEPSMVGTMAVAFPGEEEYFFIRSAASTDSDVVGYLYDNNFAAIIGEEGDFYYVMSGDCYGYVAKYLLTTGADAAQAMEEAATPIAQVNASGLMVHTDPSEDSEVIDMITEDEIVYLEEDLGGWAKISNGSVTGYVSADYVSYASLLPQGETHEEATVRIAEEEAAYEAWLAEQEQLYLEALAQEQAEWEAQNQAWIEYLQSQGQYADDAQAQADQAYADAAYADQAYADAEDALQEAYNYGDADTIAAAEEAYAQAAQAAADAYSAAENAQAEADAAGQEFDNIVADSGIDVTEVTGGEDASDTTSSQRQAIVNYALQFVGNPYVYGGTSLTNGTDCSGFTQSVLANFGISVNRTAGQQSQGGKSVDLADIQPGDLLYYSGDGDYGIGHVSMYIGNGQVVHASSSTTGIIVSDINYRTPAGAVNYID